MLRAADLDLNEPIYTFVTDDPRDPAIHVAADRLRKHVEGSGLYEPHICPWTESLTRMLESNRLGVEEDHALQLSDEALKVPGIFIDVGGGQHVLADGSHRMWRCWKRSDPHFVAYVIPTLDWIPFIVVDLGGDPTFWHEFNTTAKVRDGQGGFTKSSLHSPRSKHES
jgi:hypothetical protein